MAGVLDELLQNVRQNDSDWKNTKAAIVQKGVPVPEGTPTSEYGKKILSIETGVDTSGDTVVPSALREGYTAHDAAGQAITGTIPDYSGGNTVEMTSPEGATLNTAGTYCEGNIEVVPKLQSKTATTGEIVTADNGYVGLESVDTNPVFKAGIDAVNESIQIDGFRQDYSRAYEQFDSITFAPKYNIVPTRMYNCFSTFRASFDLQQRLEELGVVLDTSKCVEFAYAFISAIYLTRIGVISFESLLGDYPTVFHNCQNLEKIDKIILHPDVGRTFDRLFIGVCGKLSSVEIEGTISGDGFNVSWSPLSKASLTSIVNALSATTTGLTVALRLVAVNTAFETSAGAADGSTSDEWTALIATKPNWTINLINS